MQTQKLLEIIQIYNLHIIFDNRLGSKKSFFLTKFSCEILHIDFFYLDFTKDFFMQNFKLVIKTIMKNLCVKETKHIIFIDLKSSEFLNPNNYLWNLLSIIIKGVNICMIFENIFSLFDFINSH